MADPEAAMRRFLAEWPYIERGIPLPTDAEVSGVTLSGLLNLWLADRQQDVDADSIKLATWRPNCDLIDADSTELRAAILLGIHGGYSQREVAEIERKAVDLDAGWIDHLRAKTRQSRRVPLWRETIAAIKALPRNEPAEPNIAGLLFITRNGLRYVRVYVNNNKHDDYQIRCDVFGSAAEISAVAQAFDTRLAQGQLPVITPMCA